MRCLILDDDVMFSLELKKEYIIFYQKYLAITQ